MPLRFAVTIRLYIAAARSPPRSEPANNHDRRPSAMPRNAVEAGYATEVLPLDEIAARLLELSKVAA